MACTRASRRLDRESPERGEPLSSGAAGGDGRQALLDIPPVRFQVNTGQRFQQGALGAGQVAARLQVVRQASCLVERPGLECSHELALVDDAVLQRE